MDNHTEPNGSAPASVEAAAASPIEWVPPRTRDEVDQAILDLSNDIGLILAQLAEDQVAWCARTGRSPADYAAWKRRALFAKVHKEGQLRECKRIRSQLPLGSGLAVGVGAVAGAMDPEPVGRPAVDALLARCRDVVETWIDGGDVSGDARLERALGRLAECLDRIETGRSATDLPRPRGLELNGNPRPRAVPDARPGALTPLGEAPAASA